MCESRLSPTHEPADTPPPPPPATAAGARLLRQPPPSSASSSFAAADPSMATPMMMANQEEDGGGGKKRNVQWHKDRPAVVRRAILTVLKNGRTSKVARQFGIPVRTLRRYVARERRRLHEQEQAAALAHAASNGGVMFPHAVPAYACHRHIPPAAGADPANPAPGAPPLPLGLPSGAPPPGPSPRTDDPFAFSFVARGDAAGPGSPSGTPCSTPPGEEDLLPGWDDEPFLPDWMEAYAEAQGDGLGEPLLLACDDGLLGAGAGGDFGGVEPMDESGDGKRKRVYSHDGAQQGEGEGGRDGKRPCWAFVPVTTLCT